PGRTRISELDRGGAAGSEAAFRADAGPWKFLEPRRDPIGGVRAVARHDPERRHRGLHYSRRKADSGIRGRRELPVSLFAADPGGPGPFGVGGAYRPHHPEWKPGGG